MLIIVLFKTYASCKISSATIGISNFRKWLHLLLPHHKKSMRNVYIYKGLTLMSVLFVVSTLLLYGCQPTSSHVSSLPEPIVQEKQSNLFQFSFNEDGDLIRPTGYRTWVFVGTPLTPNDLNDGKAPFPEFHNVYIDPASYEHYKITGQWREGTILIKELVGVGSKAAVSGNGYFQGDFIGLEATIKSAEHFPDEPGNWAYFSFTNPGKPVNATATAFATASCNSCHQVSAGDDFVFTQYYPVLRAAKGAGVDPENYTNPEEHAGTIWESSALTPTVANSVVPVNKEELFRYLKEGGYEKMKAKESSTHPSRGPHTRFGLPVRVFLDDKLDRSLKAGSAEHPQGASAVKEMYDAEGTLSGWAVMVKTQPTSENGKGWYWYEVTSATDGNAIAANGNGVPGCVACHASGGNDMVLTAYPLN